MIYRTPFFTLFLPSLLSCYQPVSVDELCKGLSSCPDLAVCCGVFVLTQEPRCNDAMPVMSGRAFIQLHTSDLWMLTNVFHTTGMPDWDLPKVNLVWIERWRLWQEEDTNRYRLRGVGVVPILIKNQKEKLNPHEPAFFSCMDLPLSGVVLYFLCAVHRFSLKMKGDRVCR